MFLHLGSGHSVRTKDIIAIFDYALLENGLSGRKIVFCLEDGEDSAKSAVLTDKAVYLSAISALTLKKRSSLNTFI